MKTLISIILLWTCVGCAGDPRHGANQVVSSENARIHFGEISFVLPPTWKLANDDTLTRTATFTYTGRLVNSLGKIAEFQYGLATYGNVAEPNVISSAFRKDYIRMHSDTSEIVFSDNPQVVQLRQKSNYVFTPTVIDHLSATMFEPKTVEGRFFGVYIDSIGQINGMPADFLFFSEQLNEGEIKELKSFIQSIKISLKD